MARRRSTRAKGQSVAQLRRALDSGRVEPVYLVVGNEEFLRRKAIAAIVETVSAADADDMAIERLDGTAVSLPYVIDTARSLPLFVAVTDRPTRVVIVSPFDAGMVKEADLLEEYLKAPVEATCLLFEATKLDARKAASKLLDTYASRVDCDRPERESDVRRWIEGSAKSRDLEISREAVTYLLEMVGGDLQRLSQEMDKVELFAGAGARL